MNLPSPSPAGGMAQTRFRPSPDADGSALELFPGLLKSAATVFQFELGRSKTWKRLIIWVGVAVFPAVIMLMMRSTGARPPQAVWITMIFVLATLMVVLLNALLWIAPLVQTELEGRTWLYLVVRPFGRWALVLGKGLNGFAWTLAAGLVALAGAVVCASIGSVEFLQADNFQQVTDDASALTNVYQNGAILAVLTLLSAIVYSSLFMAIGCIIPKRAMLVAFSYTLIFETAVAFVPAVISRLTVQYHLRCLLAMWMEFDIPAEGRLYLFSEASSAWHVSCLLAMALFWTFVSLTVIHIRQYVMSDEA